MFRFYKPGTMLKTYQLNKLRFGFIGLELHSCRSFAVSSIKCKKRKRNQQQKTPKITQKKPIFTEEQLYEQFQDSRNIRVIAGKGGNGMSHFHRGWCLPEGGPDGGDGGKGGDVIFEADSNIKSLNKVPTVCHAEDGVKGGTTNCTGRNGKNMVVKVPIGTVFKLNSNNKLYADLGEPKEQFIAGYGGYGGKGNKFFTTSTCTAPEDSTDGELGEDRVFVVQVKTLAHCGLVGLPNAGKSTILHALTNAKPLIGDYPYTTLVPHIGMMRCHDFVQISIADIPGIIEGAHRNEGEALQFLKHIQRCKFLIYVIDLSETDPFYQVQVINTELLLHKEHLIDLPKIIVGNKYDIEENRKKFEELCNKCNNVNELQGATILPISALTRLNTEELMKKIRNLYDEEMLKIENEKTPTARLI